MNINKRIILIQEKDFKSQSDLADSLGVSRFSVGSYVNSDRRPNTDVLEKFYKLGYSIDWLISGKGSMKRTDLPSELTYILVFENNITYTSTNRNFEEAKILAEAEQIKKGLGRKINLIITVEAGKIIKIINGEESL